VVWRCFLGCFVSRLLLNSPCIATELLLGGLPGVGVEYGVQGFLFFGCGCVLGVSECYEGCDACGLWDVEGFPEILFVVVSYPACADALEVGGDGHGLEGDGGVYEAPASGDFVVCGVCSDYCECACADVAVE